MSWSTGAIHPRISNHTSCNVHKDHSTASSSSNYSDNSDNNNNDKTHVDSRPEEPGADSKHHNQSSHTINHIVNKDNDVIDQRGYKHSDNGHATLNHDGGSGRSGADTGRSSC